MMVASLKTKEQLKDFRVPAKNHTYNICNTWETPCLEEPSQLTQLTRGWCSSLVRASGLALLRLLVQFPSGTLKPLHLFPHPLPSNYHCITTMILWYKIKYRLLKLASIFSLLWCLSTTSVSFLTSPDINEGTSSCHSLYLPINQQRIIYITLWVIYIYIIIIIWCWHMKVIYLNSRL